MTVNEIRRKFIKFFEEKEHTYMSSSSLIPKDDPSVLLTTAGMQQFKDWFSGKTKPEYDRVVTIQKCVRTVDIDEVGKTNRHLTFFEMIGNFSFGDYFKEDAIKWGYEFISKELGVSNDRICFTIFEGDKEVPRDDDSEKIIKSIGNFKIEEYGREDNFWGPTGIEGPCGPTVEIYVDGVEVWNLVFNEYYMRPDKTLLPLKAKGVDTGAGLERIATTLNKLESVFETDEFAEIIASIKTLTRVGPLKGSDPEQLTEQLKIAIKIIADHTRTATFMLADGVRPSNLDRGYILRRVVRRIVRYANLSGINEQNICSKIAEKIIKIYKSNYPELEREKKHILDEMNLEEAKFTKVIEAGLKKFDQYKNNKEISGKEAFDLFTTYGFPFEMTQEMAKEGGIRIDQAGFEAEFEKHQEISRKGADKKFTGGLESGNDPKVTQYHTVAHLLLAALREVLGNHVHQKGANITSERLRFDFSHPEKMTDEEKQKVTDWINDKLSQNLEVNLDETDPETAKKKGAEGEFSSKYGNKVSVYTIGGNLESDQFVSKEICGGPHISNLSEIKGRVRIKKEESSSAGVRRIKVILE